MVKISERDGIFIVDGEDFDIKTDNNRKIYVRKKEEKIFHYIGKDIEVGFTSEEKKKYLYNLYLLLKERKEELAQK